MELILKETINTLGREGDIVTVKDGYGRNYLLPQGKAVPANKENLEILEKNKAEIAARLAEEQKKAEQIGKKLSGITVKIEQLAGEDDRLFGSVTSADICTKLKELDVDVDKKQIVLPDPIKTLGSFDIPVKIGFDVTAEIKVVVKSTEDKE